MELVVESDIYSPSIGESGEYIDKIPPFTNIKNGLRCQCGARKDKCYEAHSIFASHIHHWTIKSAQRADTVQWQRCR